MTYNEEVAVAENLPTIVLETWTSFHASATRTNIHYGKLVDTTPSGIIYYDWSASIGFTGPYIRDTI